MKFQIHITVQNQMRAKRVNFSIYIFNFQMIVYQYCLGKQEKVWGVAYHIAAQDVERVSRYLDYREKDGYRRIETVFHPHCNNDSQQNE